MYGYFGEAYFAGETIAQVVTASITVAEIIWMADWDTAVTGSAGPETIGIVESVPGGNQTITVEASITVDDSGVSVVTPGALIVNETITSLTSVSLPGSGALAAPASAQDPRVPLSVQLRSARMTRDITATVKDVTYRSTAPGGYASAAFDLNRLLLTQGDDLAEFATVRVTDSRNASVVWEGHLEDPGRTTGADGDVWRVTAIGAAAHTRDDTSPYVGIDSQLPNWTLGDDSLTRAYASTAVQAQNDVGNALVYSVSQGTAVAAGFAGSLGGVAAMLYRTLQFSGQNVGSLQVQTVAGLSNADHKFKIDVGFTNAYLASFSTSPTTVNLNSTVHFSPDTTPVLAWARQTSSLVADAVTWAAFGSVFVRPVIVDKAGATVASSGYTPTYVTAAEVIGDLLGGGRLPLFDGANATIGAAGSPFHIQHLAYPDPVTVDQILADLMVQEAGFFWAAWERNAAGKARFEWSPWPTSIRYEASTEDGFDSPGSTAELYNAVSVRYRDALGVLSCVHRTSTVAALDAIGLTRKFTLDLGDNVGSTDVEAAQAGDNFLAEHAVPPNAGTLTVARPLMDRLTGRMVGPHELLPGTLIRVRGVRPSVDSLNPSARDGVTTFRVTSVEYRASSASAVLELDSYSRTTAQAIAALSRNRITRRN